MNMLTELRKFPLKTMMSLAKEFRWLTGMLSKMFKSYCSKFRKHWGIKNSLMEVQ